MHRWKNYMNNTYPLGASEPVYSCVARDDASLKSSSD